MEEVSPGLTLAWQYYILSEAQEDKNRLNRARQIVPFSNSSADIPLEHNDTVVWRLVTIAVRPTRYDPEAVELVASGKSGIAGYR